MMDLVKHYRVSDDEAAFLDKYTVMQGWLLPITADILSLGNVRETLGRPCGPI